MSKEEAEACIKENINELIEEDDERILKGDAIGDTLYSESFILKTLVNLTQVKSSTQQIHFNKLLIF
jgi:hypothetical protein